MLFMGRDRVFLNLSPTRRAIVALDHHLVKLGIAGGLGVEALGLWAIPKLKQFFEALTHIIGIIGFEEKGNPQVIFGARMDHHMGLKDDLHITDIVF